ncbi:MAG: hypothetical protein IPG56_12320 [Caulobacteraceae bacterium]|nr:hypothetical protein [Caulobacteraceae bacterium]
MPLAASKTSATTVVDHTRQLAAEKAGEGAERIATSAQGTAEALRRAATEMHGDNAWIGTALRNSADGLDRATRSIACGHFSRGIADLNNFARNQPAIFLGASVALGFALARVGKTAIEAANDGDASPGYEDPSRPAGV